jgi:hypothetical protein
MTTPIPHMVSQNCFGMDDSITEQTLNRFVSITSVDTVGLASGAAWEVGLILEMCGGVLTVGTFYVVAGEALAYNDEVRSGAAGVAVKVQAGERGRGRVLVGAAQGEQALILLC